VLLYYTNLTTNINLIIYIQGYSPTIPNAAGELKYKTTPVTGDQLTVERGVNIIEAVQNSYSSEEKLEGIHMEIADWHAVVTFLNVSKHSVPYLKQT